MKNDWQNKELAEKWDIDTARRNPARLEQLDILVSIVADSYHAGTHILDLGFGSGQVEERILQRHPDTRVIGVDSSAAMIDLARQRLEKFPGRYQTMQHELTQLESIALPRVPIQFVLAVQVLHHLTHAKQRELFSWVYRIIEAGGTFLIVDRVTIETDAFYYVYKALWEKLEKNSELKSGMTFEQYLEKIQSKRNETALLEDHLAWLRDAGFVPACLHFLFDRALIAAQKIR
jgi:tRNA (cmo5U34)-methyltransferase